MNKPAKKINVVTNDQSVQVAGSHGSSGGTAGAAFKQGLAHLAAARLAEAEAAFREELRIDPKSAGSWTGLARAQAERGDLEEACRSALGSGHFSDPGRGLLATGHHREGQDARPRVSGDVRPRVRHVSLELRAGHAQIWTGDGP